MLTKPAINKILREAQSGNLELIKKNLSTTQLHWSTLKYDKTGDSILHCAARLGYLHILEYLLTNFTPNSVDCRNNDNKTALHEAAQFGQHECVRLLLKHGAEVNALKKADWTPLMLACTKVEPDTWMNNYNCVQILLESGALINYQNKDGWSTVHLIAREGSIQILQLLLANGLNVSLKTKNGRTALHVACLHGNLGVVKALFDLKVSIEEKDNCGNTPLHEAVLAKNIEVCKFLIQHNADINCRNNTDFSILHLACSQDDVSMIKFILNELNFNVNIVNNKGLSPLHCASRKKLLNVCDYLKSVGADTTIRDSFSRLAEDYL